MVNTTQLVQGATKVQPNVLVKAFDGSLVIEDVKITNMVGMKSKIFSATIRSSTDNKAYNTVLAFYGLDDPVNDIPSLSTTEVRTRCGCHSFYFYASYADMIHNALYGRNPKPYIRKTSPGDKNYKPPVNPQEIPLVCKHGVLLTKA